jgi:predicted HAD superfamily Cof-like phosphohydrolase
MNKQFEMVKEFQKAMEQPVADTPTAMDPKRLFQRYHYMLEELKEFFHAKTTVDQADAMIDLIYLAIGTLVEMGVKPEQLFQIVHEANMSKLWEDGKPRFREGDGKVLKPPHFVRPEPLLQEEIERQMGGS